MPEIEIYYNKILILFGRLNIASMILPIVIAIWMWKRLNKPLKVFLGYCVVTLLINLLEQMFIWSVDKYTDFWLPILRYWRIENTNFLQILYYLRDFTFLGWFYSILLPLHSEIWVKRIAISLFFATLINYLFIEGYRVYGIFNPAIDAIFSFVLPLFYLWFLYQSFFHIPLYKNPYFWLSFGLIFINLLGLFLYFAGNKMQQTDFVLFAKVVIIKNCLEIIGRIILSIGFWYAPYVQHLLPPGKRKDTPVNNF